MKPTRIIIAGGRYFNDYPLLEKAMKHLTKNLPKGTIEVVCGKAKGADTLGEKWALENNYKVKYFPADWSTHGMSAGPIRNKEMGDYATHLVAFWDGSSKGTLGMVEYAKKIGLKVRVINYE